MNTFNAYFKRHFLTSWILPVVVSVIGILILIITCNAEFVGWEDLNTEKLRTKSLLSIVTIFATVIATLLPIFEFSPFNNKKNLDTLFSLPIDKTKLLIAHYLNGALQLVISITAVYTVWLVFWVLSPYTELHTGHSLLAYPYIIAGAMILYTIYSAVFLQANTTVDGCVFMLLYTFVFFMITGTMYYGIFLNRDSIFYNYHHEFLNFTERTQFLAILGRISYGFDRVITPITYLDTVNGIKTWIYEYHHNTPSQVFEPYMCIYIFYIILAVAGVVITLKTYKKTRPINVEEISDSWLGYKILGPIYSICGVLILNTEDLFSFPVSLIVLIIMFLGYMLYRRGAKFKIPDIVVMSITTIMAIFGVTI